MCTRCRPGYASRNWLAPGLCLEEERRHSRLRCACGVHARRPVRPSADFLAQLPGSLVRGLLCKCVVSIPDSGCTPFSTHPDHVLRGVDLKQNLQVSRRPNRDVGMHATGTYSWTLESVSQSRATPAAACAWPKAPPRVPNKPLPGEHFGDIEQI